MPLAGGHPLHEADPGLQRQRRAQRAGVRRPAPGRARCRRSRCRPARASSGPAGGRWPPAELAAWTSGRVDAVGARSAASAASKRGQLAGGGRVVGLVGHGQVGQRRPRAAAPGGPTIRCGQGHGVGRGGADAVHAGVDLEVHGERRAAARRPPPPRPSMPSRRVDASARSAVRRPRRASRRGGGSDSTRIGASMPGAPQRDALLRPGPRASPAAPASSAARATGTAPWP